MRLNQHIPFLCPPPPSPTLSSTPQLVSEENNKWRLTKTTQTKRREGVFFVCGGGVEGCCRSILREVKKRKRGRGGGGGSNVRVAPQAAPCHQNLDQSGRRQPVYLLAATNAADGGKKTGGWGRRREGRDMTPAG